MTYDRPEPVAFLTRGRYVHTTCLPNPPASGLSVYAEDLPPVVWCQACEGQILSAPCVFCDIIAGSADAEWILQPDTWPDAVAFVPLNPVTEGHCLVVPKVHVSDFAVDPEVYAAVSRRVAELMRWTARPMNVITSRGAEATQSVWHLHAHLVPRAENDGLALPWYSGKKRKQK